MRRLFPQDRNLISARAILLASHGTPGARAAEAAARQAVDAEQKLWTEGRAELVRSRYLLASILARRGESDAARAEAARSLALLGRVEGVAPTLERQVRNLARELGMPGPSP